MKIIVDVQPRQYELTYLIPDSFTEGERKTIDQEIAELIQKKFAGKVVSTQDWGKKRLAYSIKFQNVYVSQAYYTHIVLELQPDKAQEFDREVQLYARIMRHLMVLATSTQEETPSAE